MEGHTTMQDTDERAPDGAAPLSLRPSRGAALRRNALTLGFSATAVAVVLVVVAVSLFGSHWRPTGPHTTATSTAGLRGQVIGQVMLPGYSSLVSISMDSPKDGWALGDASYMTNSGIVNAVGFYHYVGSTWRLDGRIDNVNAQLMPTATITMFSPSNGWAFDGMGTVFQYDGARWQSIAISPTGAQGARVLTLHMISPEEGWAAAYITSASGSHSIGFLHYDHQQWTAESAPTDLPGLDSANLSIVGFSAQPGGDAWAVGNAPVSGPTGAPLPIVGLVFHRIAGAWQLVSRLYTPTAEGTIDPHGPNLVPRDIYMSSPTSGWIVGNIASSQTNPEGYTTTTHALLMRYDGAQWTQVAAPLPLQTNGDQMFHLMATGPDNIWAAVATSAGSIMPTGLQVTGGFLHYDGAAWSEVTPTPAVKGIAFIHPMNYTIAPDGAIWSAGIAGTGPNTHADTGLFICSLKNGVWSASTFSSGK